MLLRACVTWFAAGPQFFSYAGIVFFFHRHSWSTTVCSMDEVVRGVFTLSSTAPDALGMQSRITAFFPCLVSLQLHRELL